MGIERKTDEESPQDEIFANALIGKGLPEKYREGAVAFGKAVLALTPPQGILARLADAFYYYPEENLSKDLDALTQKAKDVVGNEEYYYTMTSSEPTKSDVYFLQQLVTRGLPLPKKIFVGANQDTFHTNTFNTIALHVGGENVEVPVTLNSQDNILPSNSLVLNTADFIISGGQAIHAISPISADARVHILSVCSTEGGENRIRETLLRRQEHFRSLDFDGVHPRAIPSLTEKLTDEDIAFFNRYRKDGSILTYPQVKIFMTSNYKSPDNTPSIFYNGIKKPGTDELIVPPLLPRAVPPYKR